MGDLYVVRADAIDRGVARIPTLDGKPLDRSASVTRVELFLVALDEHVWLPPEGVASLDRAAPWAARLLVDASQPNPEAHPLWTAFGSVWEVPLTWARGTVLAVVVRERAIPEDWSRGESAIVRGGDWSAHFLAHATDYGRARCDLYVPAPWVGPIERGAIWTSRAFPDELAARV